MSKWISVHDELPELKKDVLCYVFNKTLGKHFTQISYYTELCNCKGSFRWYCDMGSYPEEVHFWQLLPEPPEDY